MLRLQEIRLACLVNCPRKQQRGGEKIGCQTGMTEQIPVAVGSVGMPHERPGPSAGSAGYQKFLKVIALAQAFPIEQNNDPTEWCGREHKDKEVLPMSEGSEGEEMETAHLAVGSHVIELPLGQRCNKLREPIR